MSAPRRPPASSARHEPRQSLDRRSPSRLSAAAGARHGVVAITAFPKRVYQPFTTLEYRLCVVGALHRPTTLCIGVGRGALAPAGGARSNDRSLPMSTNARWRSPKSLSDRSGRCASRPSPRHLRSLVHLRDRLQSLAQPDDQRDCWRATARSTDADLDQIYETYISANPLHRPHRPRRLAGDGRDRAGHGDDRRRRRHRLELHRKPRRRDPKARRRHRRP